MKSREAFSKVLASFVAVSVFAASPSLAGPIASVAVRAPIGGAPVGPAGAAFNAPGMNFSPMGASLNAPTLTGSVLPGLQGQSFTRPEGSAPALRPDLSAGPAFLPTRLPGARTQVPTLPPSMTPISDSSLSGRVRQIAERRSVAGVQDLKPTDKGREGLPGTLGDSLRTVRGQRNGLGLRFLELRKAFGLPIDDSSFSPEGSAPGSLAGHDAGSVGPSASSGAGAASTGRRWTSSGYLARAVARLAGLVPSDGSDRTRAKAPTPLGVDFSMDRLAVTIFGDAPSGLNASDDSAGGSFAARDRVLRVAVPAPGSPAGSAALASRRRAASPGGSVSGEILSSPLVLETASWVRDASVRSFADDGPVRRWLGRAIAQLNAYAPAGRMQALRFTVGSTRHQIVVPFPSLTARAAAGWGAWFSSLVVPLAAFYLYFADQLRPRLALVPAAAPRPRA